MRPAAGAHPVSAAGAPWLDPAVRSDASSPRADRLARLSCGGTVHRAPALLRRLRPLRLCAGASEREPPRSSDAGGGGGAHGVGDLSGIAGPLGPVAADFRVCLDRAPRGPAYARTRGRASGQVAEAGGGRRACGALLPRPLRQVVVVSAALERGVFFLE